MADLARETGIADLALDAEGFGIVAFDSCIIAIGYNKTAGSLDLMTCLDRVTPSAARAVEAMRANFRWSGPGCETLAVDPASGAFVLQRRYVGPELLDGGLPGAVRELLAQAGRWTARLTAIPDRAVPGDAGEDRHAMPPGGGLRA